MNTEKIKMTQNDKLYYFAYSIYVLFWLLSTTFFAEKFVGRPFQLIKLCYIAIVCFIELNNTRYKNRVLIGLAICINLYLISAYVAGILSDAIMIILLYVGRNKDFKVLAKISIVISCAVLVLTITSAKIGLINNVIETNARNREYLGFLYPLYPSAILFNVTCLVVYLKKRNIKIIELLLLLLANYWLYTQTDSRLSYYLAELIIMFAAIFKLSKKCILLVEKSKIVNFLIKYSFVICIIITIIVVYAYNPKVEWMAQANEILAQRLKYNVQAVEKYGISLFPRNSVVYIGNGLLPDGTKNPGTTLFVDNLFLSLTQKYGIILILLGICVMTNVQIKAIKKKDYYLAFILAMIAYRCLIDDLFVHLYYNTFLFAIPMLLFYETKSKFNVKNC